MGTTAGKLQAIVNAKADIGAAIKEKGGTVPQKLSEYGNAIRELPVGGAAVFPKPLDAEIIYKAFRPNIYGPIPDEVSENTIYLIYKPEESTTVLDVSFMVECEGSYSVSVGIWDTTDAYNPFYEYQEPQEFPSGETAHISYESVTPQSRFMLRVMGEGISGFSSLAGSGETTSYMSKIVEFIGNCPSLEGLNCKNMMDMEFFTLMGTSALTKVEFSRCTSLVCIRHIDLSNMKAYQSTFYECKSLRAIGGISPQMFSMRSTFYGCENLVAIPQIFSQIGTFSCALGFQDCKSLYTANIKITTKSNGVSQLFYGCKSLTAVKLDLPGVSMLRDVFKNCPSLRQLRINEGLEGWVGADFSIADCAFSRSGLIDLFESLPTITEAHTITITGNPGVADLTEEDKAILTPKNWSLSL